MLALYVAEVKPRFTEARLHCQPSHEGVFAVAKLMAMCLRAHRGNTNFFIISWNGFMYSVGLGKSVGLILHTMPNSKGLAPSAYNSAGLWPFLRKALRAGCLATAGLTTGCSSIPPEQFAGQAPHFDPITFFNGKTHSWGVFENRAGQPTRRFQTMCRGKMEGGSLRLDQDFVYDDGHRQQRHWRIRQVDAHHFEATANDVVGTGTGEAYGNAFRWDYTVALKPGNPLFNVHLRQWMYLQADGRTMLNRGTVRSLGVEVAQITEQFHHD